METWHQKAEGTGVGIFAGFLVGFLWFSQLRSHVQWRVCLPLAAGSRLRSLGSAARVDLRLPPFHSMSLVAPALPWVAWLWPATISSSGWLKSLAWPVLVGTAFGMSLLCPTCGQASTQTDSARFGSCLAAHCCRHPFIPTGLLSCGEDLQVGTPDNQAFSFFHGRNEAIASLMEALRSLISASMFPSTVVNSLLSEAMACAFRLCFEKQDMVFELGKPGPSSPPRVSWP